MRKPYSTPQSCAHQLTPAHLVCGTQINTSTGVKSTNRVSSVGAASRESGSRWDDDE